MAGLAGLVVELAGCTGSSGSGSWQQGWHQEWQPAWQGGWQQARWSPAGQNRGSAQQIPPAEAATKAEVVAKAKAEARTIKHEKQRAKKLEQTIDPSNFRMGQVHLGDIRRAQKLWTIFLLDTNTTDPVMKYAGGFVVPDNLEATFHLDMVLDHCWGLYVKKQDPQPRPSTGRAVLKPPHTEEESKGCSTSARPAVLSETEVAQSLKSS